MKQSADNNVKITGCGLESVVDRKIDSAGDTDWLRC